MRLRSSYINQEAFLSNWGKNKECKNANTLFYAFVCIIIAYNHHIKVFSL